MAEGIFGAFTSAQKAGQEFGQAIQSKNILQEAYAGASPDVAADPKEQSTILQKASVLAGQKGLQSLAHSFQKDASSLSQDVQKSQLDSLKNMQGQLGYSGQLLSALPADATTEDFNNVFANIKEPQAQMAIQSITRNPNFTSERKKELLTNLTKTVDQNLKAMQMAALGEYRERSLDIREEGILSRERTAAGRQGGMKPAKGFEVKGTESVLKSTYGKDMLDTMSDEDWTAAATKVEARARQIAKSEGIDLQDAKDMAAEEIFKPETKSTWGGLSSQEGFKYEKGTPKSPAPTATKEAQKESPKTKETKFKEGQIYTDAKGNRAMYNAGQWVPLK